METSFDTTAMNMEELQEARAILKKRFAQTIEEYLEDAEMYVKGIEQGLAQGDLEEVARHAHPLKSASRGLGVDGLASISATIEQTSKTGGTIETITPFIEPLKEALAYVTPILRNMAEEAA